MNSNIVGMVERQSWGCWRGSEGVTVSRLADGRFQVLLVIGRPFEVANTVVVSHPVRSVREAFRIARGEPCDCLEVKP
jgi:hypothetical protein